MDRTDHVERTERIDRIDIVVKARHAEVTDRFREHVKDKLGRLERLDSKAFRIDVELCHESNPRMADSCDRVELTLRSRGPVVRAEAAAQDPYGALDIAVAKLEERLRRAADRRRDRHTGHHGHPAPVRVAGVESPVSQNGNAPAPDADSDSDSDSAAASDVLMAAGPLVVREKAHDATPMSLDDALHRMELVGHDFYLYCDAESGVPSVVYRRRGYTYGVLRLRTDQAAAG